jgi:hypothetical protein
MPAYDSVLFSPPAPIAHVKLRRTGTSVTVDQVPMLLDSGADVTLVPKAHVETIGASVAVGTSYELVGFDGTKSIAPAAEFDLLFQNRAFAGRFLLIDQPWGILGRDVLNHVAILLDGPKKSWAEMAP